MRRSIKRIKPLEFFSWIGSVIARSDIDTWAEAEFSSGRIHRGQRKEIFIEGSSFAIFSSLIKGRCCKGKFSKSCPYQISANGKTAPNSSFIDGRFLVDVCFSIMEFAEIIFECKH